MPEKKHTAVNSSTVDLSPGCGWGVILNEKWKLAIAEKGQTSPIKPDKNLIFEAAKTKKRVQTGF